MQAARHRKKKKGDGEGEARLVLSRWDAHSAICSSAQWFLQHLGQSRPLPFRRLEALPGEQAQVDLGTGASILRPAR